MAEPSAVLAELSTHLHTVGQDPSTPLDVELLEQCELFTSTPEYCSKLWKETRPLFLQLASLLPKLQQDPSPIIHFITKMANPYQFDDIKDVEFEIGLDLEATPFHSLILSLLEKAATSSNDAQALANRPTVMIAIVRLWLCTKDTGIATQAADLLISLLRVSKNEPISVPGEAQFHSYGAGPIWKRLFNDRDIYSLYYQYTYFLNFTAFPLLNKRDKTVSQARLLEWLPRVGNMDWNTIVSGHGSEAEREVGLTETEGLLHYAALKMVQTADDILMHMTLVNFFSDLITTVKMKPHLTYYDSSLSLDFVKNHGIHKGIIELHTNDSPSMEQNFLASRTSHYISEYAINYPENFEKSPELSVIRQFIQRNICNCEPNDLNILVSMPRQTLIPRTSTGFAWGDGTLLDVPIIKTRPEALKTLATVFHGPPKAPITFPQVESVDTDLKRIEVERIYARILTSLYFTKNPSMFTNIVTHSETIAIKENALAALALLRAVITSDWEANIPPDLIADTDPIFLRLQQFPKTGIDVILDPSISGGVLPSLLKPATSFSNLVGGHGDAEDAAYQVAIAKFDVLKALGQRLEKESRRQDVLTMVQRRISEGPWGVSGGVGSRIGTLDL
ncbi:hypothetical protein K505DRAFT_238867 [Melanomma pulvis-pyrius CBS 109.77]|uniref:Uncharacterized protein n=1 Tax=Melanomma pulvis-pyrius CBS 109.77 TaxID=1314802 RepID=A0A6A6XIL9_9PLEO|nr:hypothetical protein K505DRAFT_238867 [Melanomma pulvis-pyrius CBS 109.77]